MRMEKEYTVHEEYARKMISSQLQGATWDDEARTVTIFHEDETESACHNYDELKAALSKDAEMEASLYNHMDEEVRREYNAGDDVDELLEPHLKQMKALGWKVY
jgi:hypothetical protein